MKHLMLIFCFLTFIIAQPIHVTFVNPGSIDDPFFKRLCSVMQSAAKDLDISLEILHSGRDYINGIEIGKEILHQANRPEFLLLINEDGMAERLLPEADSLGVKCILFNEGLSEQFLSEIKKPASQTYNCLVSQVLPNDSLAGYLLAKELFTKKLREQKRATVLALSGSPRTSSSILRKRGFQQALREYPDISVLQVIPAHWLEEKAEFITKQAFKRYATIDIIWSASDLMALGALKSAHEQNSNSIVGGIDWASFAFEKVEKNEFTATVGGHFFDGAWALILLHDYVKGIRPKVHYLSNSFYAITSDNIDVYKELLISDNWDFINFKKFSKFWNKDLKEYTFTLNDILSSYDKTIQ